MAQKLTILILVTGVSFLMYAMTKPHTSKYTNILADLENNARRQIFLFNVFAHLSPKEALPLNSINL